MIAFWRYDLFPYCLSGKVDRENPNGSVYVREYQGNFYPIAILPDAEGEKIAKALDELRLRYADASRALLAEYTDEAGRIADFLKR